MEWAYTYSDKFLMNLEITFPKDVNVDWNYYLEKEATIMADEKMKDKNVLGAIMKTKYDTKEFVKDVTQSDIMSYFANFNELN
jgi:hypothetical protein